MATTEGLSILAAQFDSKKLVASAAVVSRLLFLFSASSRLRTAMAEMLLQRVCRIRLLANLIMKRPPTADWTCRASNSTRGMSPRQASIKQTAKECLNSSLMVNGQSKTGLKTKKSMSNIDVFKQIINERHIVMKLSKEDPFRKMNKKVITPALRNGIVTRAFSRNKLELFTRQDPSQLRLNLKERVNSIINKVDLSFKSTNCKPADRFLKFKPQFTEGHSTDIIQTTDRMRLHTMADQSMTTNSQSRKELGLKDFPQEKMALQLQEGAVSKKKRFTDRSETRFVSPKLVMNKSASNASVDFFPARYKMSAIKDRAIVNAFNQSFTSSGRNSLSRQRVSEFPSPQA